MTAIDKQQFLLDKYLEIEALLNEFFHKVDFCRQNCINKKIGLFSKYARGDVGCCMGEFYRFSGKLSPEELALLNAERIRKYGKPKNDEEPIFGLEKPCSYHTKDGCVLKDHKGIACISYVCAELKKYLKEKFGIDYDYDAVRDIVEGVLVGEVSEDSVKDFMAKVRGWIEKLNCQVV